MHQYKGETGQGGWKERACADYDAAEYGTEHDDDDVVEGGSLAKGANPGNPNEGQGYDEGEDGPADHLEAIEVFTDSEKCMDQLHG